MNKNRDLRIILFLSLALVLFSLILNRQKNESPRVDLSEKPKVSSNPPAPASSTSRQIAQTVSPKKMAESLESYKTDSTLRLQKNEMGQITQISGFKYPAQSSDDVIKFSKALAADFGIPFEQLDTQSLPTPDNPYLKIYRFPQKYEDYLVFGSYLQISQSLSSKDIFLVNNELRPFNKIDLSVNVNSEVAEKSIKKEYGGSSKIASAEPQQQIYVEASKAELAWVYTVKVDGSLLKQRRIVIGAGSGRILYDKSLVIKN